MDLDREHTRRVVIGIALLGAMAAPFATSAAPTDSVPASVLACHAEPDSLRRLVCYDREVGKYAGQSGATSNSQPADSPGRESRAASEPPGTAARASAEPPASKPPAAAAQPAPPKQVSARIASIENIPDALVVHLENGQVWQQIQEASASVNWHAGDTVTIERQLASFWMSGRDGVAIKVKQKQ